MAYEKQTWQNYPSTETPLSEDRLNHMEQGIFEASQNVGATAMIAAPWTARVYRAGEYATNDGKVWLCLVPNSSAPTEGANWTSVTLGGEIRKAIGFKFSTRAEYDSWRNSADYVPGAIAFIKENSIADSTNIKHENTNVHDELVRQSDEIATQHTVGTFTVSAPDNDVLYNSFMCEARFVITANLTANKSVVVGNCPIHPRKSVRCFAHQGNGFQEIDLNANGDISVFSSVNFSGGLLLHFVFMR